MSDQRKPRNRKVVERGPTRSSLSEPSVNMDELRELIALLRENGLAEFELEREGFRVRLRRDSGLANAVNEADTAHRQLVVVERTPAPTNNSSAPSIAPPATSSSPAHPGARAESKASEDQDLYIIPSPIVGTFYRAASPTAEPFVKIGSQVTAETVVCIIEAMKLMNEIQAEASGEVAKSYVENGNQSSMVSHYSVLRGSGNKFLRPMFRSPSRAEDIGRNSLERDDDGAHTQIQKDSNR